MVELVLVAVSLGLSNFAAAISVGVGGVGARVRAEVGLVFGVFEAGMPLVGLALGRGLAHTLGGAARWTGGGLLVAVGLYGLYTARRPGVWTVGQGGGVRRSRLVAAGLALSIDNLVVGFALGGHGVPVVAAAVLIGVVSVGLSLAGLELGAGIGRRVGERAEILAALVLLVVGVLAASGVL